MGWCLCFGLGLKSVFPLIHIFFLPQGWYDTHLRSNYSCFTKRVCKIAYFINISYSVVPVKRINKDVCIFLDFILHHIVLQQTEWSLRHLLRHILLLQFLHTRSVFQVKRNKWYNILTLQSCACLLGNESHFIQWGFVPWKCP